VDLGGIQASGFPLDEHIPLTIRARLQQLAPAMRVLNIGDGVAPPKGTPDPELLAWIEAHDCLLVTNNRATMPVHPPAHLASGRHVPGIVVVPRRIKVGAIVKDLLLLWGAKRPGEFHDRVVYLPLRR